MRLIGHRKGFVSQVKAEARALSVQTESSLEAESSTGPMWNKTTLQLWCYNDTASCFIVLPCPAHHQVILFIFILGVKHFHFLFFRLSLPETVEERKERGERERGDDM